MCIGKKGEVSTPPPFPHPETKKRTSSGGVYGHQKEGSHLKLGLVADKPKHSESWVLEYMINLSFSPFYPFSSIFSHWHTP